MTRHLGDRLTALIDGELDHGTRDRMLGHLAQCDECRAAADAERRMKSRLGALAAPQVPVELMLGLLSLDTNRGAGTASNGVSNGMPNGVSGGVSGGGTGPAAGSPGNAPSPFSFQTVPIRPPAAPAAGRPVAGRSPVRPQRLRVAAIGAVSLAALGTGVWLVGDFSASASPSHAPAQPAPAQVVNYGPGH